MSAFLRAHGAAIEEIIAGHEPVRQLLGNRWLHLFRLAESGADIEWRVPGQGWVDALPEARE